MGYKVVVSSIAEKEIEQIVEHYFLLSSKAAFLAIEKSTRSICNTV